MYANLPFQMVAALCNIIGSRHMHGFRISRQVGLSIFDHPRQSPSRAHRSSAFQPGCRPRQDIFPQPRAVCAAEAVMV